MAERDEGRPVPFNQPLRGYACLACRVEFSNNADFQAHFDTERHEQAAHVPDVESLRAALREATERADEAERHWETFKAGYVGEKRRAEAAERKVDEVQGAARQLDDWATLVSQSVINGDYQRLKQIREGMSDVVACPHRAKVDEYRQRTEKLQQAIVTFICTEPITGDTLMALNDALRVEQPRDAQWCYECNLSRYHCVHGFEKLVAEPERETPQSKHDEHFAAGFDAEGCELCMDAAECCQPEGKAAPFTLIHAEDCCRSG